MSITDGNNFEETAINWKRGEPPIPLIAELKGLAHRCHTRRVDLLHAAQRSQRTRRCLQASAGALALISGALSSAIFSNLANDLFGGVSVKVFTAGAALFSGLTTIILRTFAKGKARSAMLKGANAFALLRDKIDFELSLSGRTVAQLENRLTKSNKTYGKLRKRYQRYLGHKSESMKLMRKRVSEQQVD